MTSLNPGSAKYQDVEDSLLRTLQEMEADERAIRISTEKSFMSWAAPVVEKFLQGLGYSAGAIAGALARMYRKLWGALSSGFKAGYKRGRGG